MATERQQPRGRIHPEAFNAAVTFPRIQCLRELLHSIKPEGENTLEVLKSTTPGGENSLLHLAASVGNLPFVQEFLQLLNESDPEGQPLLVNAQGNTELYLAAQGGFYTVVETLLQSKENGVDIRNKLNETALLKACESGNLDTVKGLFAKCSSSLPEQTVDRRNCLIVAVNRGDSDLVDYILKLSDAKQLIQLEDECGNKALHIAVGRNYVPIMTRLIKSEPELCYWINKSYETPLCVAVKLGRLEAVKELIKLRPDAVEIRSSCGMNVLHSDLTT